MVNIVENIEKSSIKNPKEQYQLLKSIYEFIFLFDSSLSVKENIKNILEDCNAILEKGTDTTPWARAGIERDVHHQNDVFNRRNLIVLMTKHLAKIQLILEKIVKDPVYCEEVKTELEAHLFESPTTRSRFADAFVRVFGNMLGMRR